MAKTNQKPDGRGGKRPGAGRPKGYSPGRETLSVRQVKEMLEKANAFAKKHEKTIDEILLEFIYGETDIALMAEGTIEERLGQKVAIKDRIACIKLWKEYTSPKITEGGEGDKELGPAVFLPDRHPRLKVVDVSDSGKS